MDAATNRTAPRCLVSSIIVPTFDHEDFERDVEERSSYPASGFAVVYTRVIDIRCTLQDAIATESGILAPARGLAENDTAEVVLDDVDLIEDVTESEIEEAMYARYLNSEYDTALALATRLLANDPTHTLAKLVGRTCVDAINEAIAFGEIATEPVEAQ